MDSWLLLRFVGVGIIAAAFLLAWAWMTDGIRGWRTILAMAVLAIFFLLARSIS
jgi:hypothetical protein